MGGGVRKGRGGGQNKTTRAHLKLAIKKESICGSQLVLILLSLTYCYSTHCRVLSHRNWQIESAALNLAGFLHCALETRWQRFGQFLNDL